VKTSSPAIEAELEALLAARRADPITATTIASADVERMLEQHGLDAARALALLALPVAARLARPPISNYRVGVVGIDDGGDLVLGANLEFPGSDLGSTIHAEGFATLRARSRGRTLQVLALSEARPCAHCRQTLAESVGAGDLELIDPAGNRRRLDDLYPWPFTPAALGIAPDDPRRPAWPGLEIVPGDVPAAAREALVDAGRRAHAPYSRCPSAVVIRMRDGRLLRAGCVESVSFNPTITAMQAALVELVAVGGTGDDVEGAWLGVARGTVDPVPAARALLAAIAPDVTLTVVEFRLPGDER
jgi:cytidine deaminase